MSEAAVIEPNDFLNPYQEAYNNFAQLSETLTATHTPKQLELIRLVITDALPSVVIIYGSKGSGKTIGSLKAWVIYILQRPVEYTFLMAGKTLRSLERNCLNQLRILYGKSNVSWSLTAKKLTLFGRTIWLEGAKDTSSWVYIQGLTVYGVYLDEVSNMDEQFFIIALGSARGDDDSKIFATTNPDKPRHWLKENFINKRNDEGMSLAVFFFGIDDNTFLPQKVKERLKVQYQGVFYKRYILGKWVAAEGSIYDIFSNNKDDYLIESADMDYSKIKFSTLGVDIGGTKSGYAFVHTAFSHDMTTLYVLDSDYWNDKETVTTTPDQLNKRFEQFYLNQRYAPAVCYFESAETTLYNGLKSYCGTVVRAENVYNKRDGGIEQRLRVPIEIKKCQKPEIIDRIRFLVGLMGIKKFKIVKTEGNKELIKALDEAVYNEKNLTADERLDDGKTSNIDIIDAFEYTFTPYMKIVSQANHFIFH